MSKAKDLALRSAHGNQPHWTGTVGDQGNKHLNTHLKSNVSSLVCCACSFWFIISVPSISALPPDNCRCSIVVSSITGQYPRLGIVGSKGRITIIMGGIGCQLHGKFPRSRVRVALTCYLKSESIVRFLCIFSLTYRFCRHDRLHKRRLSKHHLSLWTESFEDDIRYTRKVPLTLKRLLPWLTSSVMLE